MADNSADPKNKQAVMVPTNLLQSILTELKELRAENKETKILLNSLLSTKTIPNRGAFELFPKLPIEIRNAIWEIVLNVPRVVGAKIVVRNSDDDAREARVPTSPNSTLLLVSQESRSLANPTLLKCAEQEQSSQNRVPMLYLNPRVDTLWVVNYNWFRGRNERMTAAVFAAHKISKLAVPASFYIGMVELSDEIEDKTIEVLVHFYKKGIKELILVVGDEKAAEAEDAVFIEPRDIPISYLDNRWCEGIDPNYLDSQGEDILPWSSCNNWATNALDYALDGYMARRRLSEDTCPIVRELTESEKILVEWAKGEWKLPAIRFLEATTRKELSKLNVSF